MYLFSFGYINTNLLSPSVVLIRKTSERRILQDKVSQDSQVCFEYIDLKDYSFDDLLLTLLWLAVLNLSDSCLGDSSLDKSTHPTHILD